MENRPNWKAEMVNIIAGEIDNELTNCENKRQILKQMVRRELFQDAQMETDFQSLTQAIRNELNKINEHNIQWQKGCIELLLDDFLRQLTERKVEKFQDYQKLAQE